MTDITNKNVICMKLRSINTKLIDLYNNRPKDLLEKEKDIQLEILDLIESTTNLLTQEGRLNNWAKMYLASSIEQVKSNLLYVANGQIENAITNDSKISPDNAYPQPIIEMTLNNITDLIKSAKSRIQKTPNSTCPSFRQE